MEIVWAVLQDAKSAMIQGTVCVINAKEGITTLEMAVVLVLKVVKCVLLQLEWDMIALSVQTGTF